MSRSDSERYILALKLSTAAGLLLRLGLSAISWGSNDATLFHRFATGIHQIGLPALYAADPMFNHPPLPGYWSSAALWFAERTGLMFPFVFRLAPIAADAISCWLLWRIWSKRAGAQAGWLAAALHSCSLAAILISGYHCNTDSIYAMLCLAAVYLIVERRAHLAGGLALGAAINIKLIPLVLVPAIVPSYRQRAPLMRLLGGLLIASVPFIVMHALAGPALLRNVLEYTPLVDPWGIAFIMLEALKLRPAAAEQIYAIGEAYYAAARWIIMGSAALLGAVQHFTRRWSGYELGAIVLGLFLVLTPGFGIQHVVIVTPLMMAVSMRWAAGYGLIGGVFALLSYVQFYHGGLPLRSESDMLVGPPATVVGFAAWLVLVGFVVERVLRRTPREGARSGLL